MAECSEVDSLFAHDLPNILKPRVPGTESHTEVEEYIFSRLKQLGPRWEVTTDIFTASTPIGNITFTNIIATLDPSVGRRLLLTAHYDSKMTPHNFLGATDSALPCALLLDLAHALNSKLQTRGLEEFSLQLIFFDGEEAFHRWNENDSIYGSRHLAEEMSRSGGLLSVGDKTGLQAIETFVLLDLLGAKIPRLRNFFAETSDLYERMQKIEKRLNNEGLLEGGVLYFQSTSLVNSRIEDDHIPFLRKGVPILHLIALPFPDVWHKTSDNLSALDKPTVANLRKIFLVFLHEYFHLK